MLKIMIYNCKTGKTSQVESQLNQVKVKSFISLAKQVPKMPETDDLNQDICLKSPTSALTEGVVNRLPSLELWVTWVYLN